MYFTTHTKNQLNRKKVFYQEHLFGIIKCLRVRSNGDKNVTRTAHEDLTISCGRPDTEGQSGKKGQKM